MSQFDLIYFNIARGYMIQPFYRFNNKQELKIA